MQSTNTLGSDDLDLRPAEMMRSTMNSWVQICPHCSYCSNDIGRPARNPAMLQSDRYRAVLENGEYPLLARRFLAYALTLEDSAPVEAANVYLWAAWVCDDEEKTAQATECQSKAIDWSRRHKSTDDEEALTMGTVLVDLLRRSGRFAEASSECAALLSRASDHDCIRDVLTFEQLLISRADAGVHSISESVPPRPRPWWQFW